MSRDALVLANWLARHCLFKLDVLPVEDLLLDAAADHLAIRSSTRA